MYVLYTDGSILAGPDEKELSNIIQEIAAVGLDITEKEGGLEDFLGVNIEKTPEGAYHFRGQTCYIFIFFGSTHSCFI
jgi:hypothetical protein